MFAVGILPTAPPVPSTIDAVTVTVGEFCAAEGLDNMKLTVMVADALVPGSESAR